MKPSKFKKLKSLLTTVQESAERRVLQVQKNSSTDGVFIILLILVFLCSVFLYEQYHLDRVASKNFCERMQIKCSGDTK